MEFIQMNSLRKVDLRTYLPLFMAQNPDCLIHVGCDSQNYASKTVYVSTVVLRFPNKGAHVLYQKEKHKRINDMWTRLWGEIERSVTLATFIENECEIKVHQVDMDFNEDPDFPSHKMLNAASGYVTSLGFKAKAKPHLLMATWAANVLCH